MKNPKNKAENRKKDILDDQGNKVMTKIYDAQHRLKYVIRYNVVVKCVGYEIKCAYLYTPIKDNQENGTQRGVDAQNRLRFERIFENGDAKDVFVYNENGDLIPVHREVVIVDAKDENDNQKEQKLSEVDSKDENNNPKQQVLPEVDENHYLTVTKYATGRLRSAVSHLKKENTKEKGPVDGPAVFWWPNGNKSKEVVNCNGRPKLIYCYDENEVLSSKEEFTSTNHSLVTFFYADGKTPARTEEHWCGLRGGMTKYLDEYGNVVGEEYYWNNQLTRRNNNFGVRTSHSRATK